MRTTKFLARFARAPPHSSIIHVEPPPPPPPRQNPASAPANCEQLHMPHYFAITPHELFCGRRCQSLIQCTSVLHTDNSQLRPLLRTSKSLPLSCICLSICRKRSTAGLLTPDIYMYKPTTMMKIITGCGELPQAVKAPFLLNDSADSSSGQKNRICLSLVLAFQNMM